MNKQLKSAPAGNKGLKKLPTEVRNKMGFMSKGGTVMKSKGGAVKMSKGGAVKMSNPNFRIRNITYKVRH